MFRKLFLIAFPHSAAEKFRISASLTVGLSFDDLIPYFPDYKSHLNISRTPLFLPKIWRKKIIDKSHLSIRRTLFCYFLARRYVLGCIHVMRRSAKERQDAIDVVQKTLNAGLIAWAKVCGDAVMMPSQDMCDVCGSKSGVRQGARAACSARTSGGRFPTLCRCVQ